MKAILTWHSVDRSGSAISVTPEEFGAQVAWLASGRVRVVPLPDLATLPPRVEAVALTFDDGFRNFVTEAWPVLHAAGLPVTLFAVAGHAGGTNAWGGIPDPRVPTLPLLEWPELARLAVEGVRLGAHTRTHPHLTRLAPSELEEELEGAAEILARETGRRPEEIAYPFGDVNDAVAEAARRCYRLGVTTELRAVSPEDDPLQLPRLDMFYFRSPGRLAQWGTPAFGRRLWLRAQARRLRATLTPAGGAW